MLNISCRNVNEKSVVAVVLTDHQTLARRFTIPQVEKNMSSERQHASNSAATKRAEFIQVKVGDMLGAKGIDRVIQKIRSSKEIASQTIAWLDGLSKIGQLDRVGCELRDIAFDAIRK